MTRLHEVGVDPDDYFSIPNEFWPALCTSSLSPLLVNADIQHPRPQLPRGLLDNHTRCDDWLETVEAQAAQWDERQPRSPVSQQALEHANEVPRLDKASVGQMTEAERRAEHLNAIDEALRALSLMEPMLFTPPVSPRQVGSTGQEKSQSFVCVAPGSPVVHQHHVQSGKRGPPKVKLPHLKRRSTVSSCGLRDIRHSPSGPSI